MGSWGPDFATWSLGAPGLAGGNHDERRFVPMFAGPHLATWMLILPGSDGTFLVMVQVFNALDN